VIGTLPPFDDPRLRVLADKLQIVLRSDPSATRMALDVLVQVATMPAGQQRSALHMLRQFGSLPPYALELFVEHVSKLEDEQVSDGETAG